MKGLWIKVGTVALALAATQATARMYKCVDAQGGITYSQQQCPEAEKVERVEELAPPAKARAEAALDSDYYSIENQARRMGQGHEAKQEKKLTSEERSESQRDAVREAENNIREIRSANYDPAKCASATAQAASIRDSDPLYRFNHDYFELTQFMSLHCHKYGEALQILQGRGPQRPQ